MPAGRPPNPGNLCIERLYTDLGLNRYYKDRTKEMPDMEPMRKECPVTARACEAAGCASRTCSIGSHIGRLTEATVRGLLRTYAAVEESTPQRVLRLLVRVVLNDPDLGPLLRQDLIEASLDASGGEEGLHVRH